MVNNKKIHESVIIGAGPAGISAAIYIKRAGLEVFVIHNNKSSLQKSEHIQNYYGFFGNKLKSGEDLYENGIKQAEALGIEILEDEIINVEYEFDEKYFILTSSSGNNINCWSLLFATGENRREPEIKNFSNYKFKGISYCAICDGFFFKGKPVAVLGSGSYALSEAHELVGIASEVYILTDAKPPEADFDGFKIYNKKINSLTGEQKLGGVIFEGGEVLSISGLFVAAGTAGSMDFAMKMGVEVSEGRIVTYDSYKTSLSGLFLAGDNIAVYKQVAEAVYHGMNAGFMMIKYVKDIKKEKSL